MPNMLPWSVRASAGCFSSRAFLPSPEIRAEDWSMEYSEWVCRCTNPVSMPLLHDSQGFHLFQHVLVTVAGVHFDADELDGILMLDEQERPQRDTPGIGGIGNGVAEFDFALAGNR